MRVRPARAATAVVLTLVLLTPVTYAAQLSMQEIPLPLNDTYSQLSDDARKGDSGFSGFYRYVFITDDDKESPTDNRMLSIIPANAKGAKAVHSPVLTCSSQHQGKKISLKGQAGSG